MLKNGVYYKREPCSAVPNVVYLEGAKLAYF